MPTYARYPLTLVRGEGTRVWDEDGREYLDFAGGARRARRSGTRHPAWVEAVKRPARHARHGEQPVHHGARRRSSPRGSPRRCSRCPDARVFFCNSGAEANEAAIKLARKHGLAIGKPAIVALEGSFHGRTVAALAATGQPGKRAAFEPLVDWFRFVPPGDLDGARRRDDADDVGAVLLEPVLGEGGVLPLADGYLRGGADLCDARGALLVADEVQSGSGRCGDWLAVSRIGRDARRA